jgi:hypothetical protein
MCSSDKTILFNKRYLGQTDSSKKKLTFGEKS